MLSAVPSIALAMEKNNIDEKKCTCHSHSKKKHRVSLWCVNILFFSSRSGDGLSVFYIHSSEDFISSFFLLLRMFSYQLKQKRKRYLCKCLLSFFHFLLFSFSSAKLLFSSSSSLSLGRWGSTQLEICFIFPFNHNFHLNMFHFPTVPKLQIFSNWVWDMIKADDAQLRLMLLPNAIKSKHLFQRAALEKSLSYKRRRISSWRLSKSRRLRWIRDNGGVIKIISFYCLMCMPFLAI